LSPHPLLGASHRLGEASQGFRLVGGVGAGAGGLLGERSHSYRLIHLPGTRQRSGEAG
jgi:hypothetical protein